MIPDPTNPKKAILVLRVTSRRKTAYVRAARGEKLAHWIFATLDREAGHEEPAEDREP